MSNKRTIKEEGYKYIRYSPYYGGHILENESGKWELWVANKNHASFGLIYKNTHLEFAQTITDNVPVSFTHLFKRRENFDAMFEYFHFEMSKEDALSVSHQGDCWEDTKALLPKYSKTLDRIPWTDICRELISTGAWTQKDIDSVTIDENYQRIIWLAGCQIKEDLLEKER